MCYGRYVKLKFDDGHSDEMLVRSLKVAVARTIRCRETEQEWMHRITERGLSKGTDIDLWVPLRADGSSRYGAPSARLPGDLCFFKVADVGINWNYDVRCRRERPHVVNADMFAPDCLLSHRVDCRVSLCVCAYAHVHSSSRISRWTSSSFVSRRTGRQDLRRCGLGLHRDLRLHSSTHMQHPQLLYYEPVFCTPLALEQRVSNCMSGCGQQLFQPPVISLTRKSAHAHTHTHTHVRTHAPRHNRTYRSTSSR